MYFWQIEKLKREMVGRPLSESEILPYLVVQVTLVTAGSYIPQALSNIWDILSTILSTVLALIGTIYVYKQNGGADGQHFLQRYLVVGWVTGVRWMLLFVVPGFIFLILIASVSSSAEETTWYECLLYAILEVLFYQRVGWHIRGIAQKSAAR